MTREEAIGYLKSADVTVGREPKTKTAEALDMAIEVLEQEPCEDCISRQAAIEQIQRYGVGCFDADDFSPEECERFVIHILETLPPITPQQKIGRWMDNNCSICGYGVQPWNNTSYCPNCGAKMQEVEE